MMQQSHARSECTNLHFALNRWIEGLIIAHALMVTLRLEQIYEFVRLCVSVYAAACWSDHKVTHSP